MIKRTVLNRVILSIIVLLIGVFGMRAMIASKKAQEKQIPKGHGALVETMNLHRYDSPLEVKTHGTVQPLKMVDLAPQVGGRVSFVSENLVVGGFFKQGEILFEIEPDDIQLALERAKSNLVKAEFELTKMESQARIAKKEWSKIKNDDLDKPSPLLLYEPQLKNARSGVEAAKADVAQQELNLQRTKVSAPFNCMVKSEHIEVGQNVLPGQSVMSLRGTDTAEIIIPVTFSDLVWLDVPKKGGKGSEAVVEFKANGTLFSWAGYIQRGLGEVDPQGRMLRLVVQIDDPYGLKDQTENSEIALVDGLFVNVTMKGRHPEDTFEIPSLALHQDNQLWIVNPEMKLESRAVSLVRNQGESVLVKGPITAGEQLILTYLPGASDGMPLRVKEPQIGGSTLGAGQ